MTIPIVIIIIDRIQFLKLCVKYLLVEDTIIEKSAKIYLTTKKCSATFELTVKKKRIKFEVISAVITVSLH